MQDIKMNKMDFKNQEMINYRNLTISGILRWINMREMERKWKRT